MARRRMIHPDIWESEDFSKLSMLAKLLFIGMFSMADDEGKGRAKPVYLKSIIFPYDDGMRIIDVEKALSEIGSNMSVTFYAHDENYYYRIDSWDKWQRVDKPQPSKIPEPQAFDGDSGMIPESVENDSVLKEIKRKEVKRREERGNENNGARPRAREVFRPPAVEEVREYCESRGNAIDAEEFVAFYASKGWKVGNQAMKDWKQAVVTWEKRRKGRDPPPDAETTNPFLKRLKERGEIP